MFFNLFDSKPFALDISDFSIELIALEGSLDSPKLAALGRSELPPDLVEDGKILKEDELADFIQKIVQKPKFGRLKSKKVIFSLPESRSFIHFSESLTDIKEQVLKNFPFAPEELCFDYQLFGKETVLAAVPKEIIEGYLSLFRKCQLELIVIETESVSLGRVFSSKAETILVCDIGARTANLNIFDQGLLKFSSSLAVAGSNFTGALSEKLKISLAQAEQLKKEVGLNPQIKEGKIFLILQKEIQLIIEEINKILDYFKQKSGKAIEKIILVGGSSSLPRLLEYFSENLPLPVEIGDPWLKINIDILKKKEFFKEALEIDPVLYSLAIGAALRGLEKNPRAACINFLKKVGN